MNHTDQLDPSMCEFRRSISISIEAHGFRKLPNHILDLIVLLASPTIDVRSVGEILLFEPLLLSQVICLESSIRSDQDPSMIRIDEAIVLLGSEFLHSLVLSFAMMESIQRQPL